jgi:hypothetical protein
MKTTHFALSLLAVGAAASLVIACFSDTTSPSTKTDTKANGSAGDTAGGTGGGSAGASAGTGNSGSPSTGGATGETAADLVDDMEGATGSILAKAGRVGAWYIYNDATAGATQMPGVPFLPSTVEPPRGASTYAARMQGSGFTTWGAGMGLNFNDPGDGDGGSVKGTYDASAVGGITFWAKIGTGSVASVRVNISTKETDPSGGTCTPAAKCSDHFGKSINLTTDWVQYTIKFGDLTQLGWGQTVPKFNPAAIYACQFQVGKGTTFDVWIDDVALIPK